MLKCIAKCSKGYDRCCFNCELKRLCPDACPKDPKKCEHVEDNGELRREKREKRMDSRFLRLYIIGAVAFLALLFTLMIVIGNQNADTIRDTDILDKLNEISVEADMEESYVLVPEPDPNALTDSERDLVERVVAAEARGETIEGQAAVAQVIRDRAYTWDMTITEVCLAKGQFANPYLGEISIDTWIAVSKVFDGGVSVLEVPTTHFFSGDDEPYWVEGKVNRGSIGCHEFWY